MASDELASRIWGEGAKAVPGADAPPADGSPDPRLPRGKEGPDSAGPPELRDAGQPASEGPPSPGHPVPAGRRRAEAALAAQAREIRDLRAAVEALSATVQAVRDDLLRELTAAPRLSKEVDALGERLDALENTARTTMPRAMIRAVDRRLERRLAELLGHIEGRLQENRR